MSSHTSSHLSSILLTQCTFETFVISVESWLSQFGFLKLYITLPENTAPEKLRPFPLFSGELLVLGRVGTMHSRLHLSCLFPKALPFWTPSPAFFPSGSISRSLCIWCEFPQSISWCDNPWKKTSWQYQPVGIHILQSSTYSFLAHIATKAHFLHQKTISQTNRWKS